MFGLEGYQDTIISFPKHIGTKSDDFPGKYMSIINLVNISSALPGKSSDFVPMCLGNEIIVS